ncbi:YdeI/OmpD-associated family protein [Draconibacterium sp. IB214405]|uniref:YdeI/OmpD-associated family protein n=1 Tax=Draconibacterium sp. IB214405 TaxID=3097352 RepID=UPI002A0BF00D|nr:YdeI/OmpD-associated family protein [Draconibacterium sp. IB214405]MDX8338912.1 YdeI/OmpD-associated family protein [Draconibacterium sp. IB214405]
MNKSVENYFINGCGRCPLGGTADCKVHSWMAELELLRKIVLDCGLTEESKWGVPCYTYRNKNILMVSAFKNYSCISFFKGALLNDSKKLLDKPGPNSQATRFFKFKSTDEIQTVENDIKAYIFEAVEVEKAGIKVAFKTNPEPVPEELEAKFAEDPILKTAFEALTPGRQRGYILFFSQAKQSKTIQSRIEKCTPMILAGIGLHDNYKSKKKEQGHG